MSAALMRRFIIASARSSNISSTSSSSSRTCSSFACSTSTTTRGRNSSKMLRFSTFAQHNFNDDAHHHHHHRHHHRQQQRVTTMIKKSGGNSYYRASPILKMSASDNKITSDLIESMRVNIREQLEAETVEVMDLSGNGRHVAIKVVSEKFEGKSAVNRQRMVYKAIWMELQDQVHAVNEMVTNTPEEEKKENP